MFIGQVIAVLFVVKARLLSALIALPMPGDKTCHSSFVAFVALLQGSTTEETYTASKAYKFKEVIMLLK
ncbi:hypothetical protein [Rufibacter ruber]|uniref:hypothetical protein n=1 Tax=Rufibacter ruber TaxID=1783499 RepID=UPI000AAE18A9|nr:hypothetical protein [Rufibacter ruber]